MPDEQTGQSETPAKKEKRPVKNRIIVAGVLLIAAFLAGLLPSYSKAKHLESDLRAARQESSRTRLRDLACLVYFQASRKDYGLAAGTTTRLFDLTREAANQSQEAGARKPLEDLLSLRDPITAQLANGDPGVLNDLQALFIKTRQATSSPSGALQTE
jgi:hypothetical protein